RACGSAELRARPPARALSSNSVRALSSRRSAVPDFGLAWPYKNSPARLPGPSAQILCGRARLSAMGIISRGFRGRGRGDDSGRLPPGQYVTDDFPVLSAGPTPHTPLGEWTFAIEGGAEPVTWTWDEFRTLPSETVTKDIHCVTKWSKFDTDWEGVSVDTLLEQVEHDRAYAVAFSDGGYTTNLPLEDLTGGKAWVAYAFGGEPL